MTINLILKITLFLSIILSFNVSFAAIDNNKDKVRLLNKGQPLVVNLTINKEVQIIFSTTIEQIAIPAGLQNKISVESIDSRAWFRATADFNQAKFLVKDTAGKIVVILLSSSKTIIKHKVYKVINEITEITNIKKPDIKKYSPSYVVLTRFVAQTLYAPKRLIKDIGLYRVPVSHLTTNLFICYDNVLLCNDGIDVKPIVAYKNALHYITAIQITNKNNHSVDLDPRDIRGDFLAASFHFNRLGKAGSNTDTSVLYLISMQAFEQSL